MDILFTDKAAKEFEKIAKGNKKIAVKIRDKICEYAANPKGMYDIKKLKGKDGERKRLRVGDYRIIFKVEKKTMIISVIKHRQEVYDD